MKNLSMINQAISLFCLILFILIFGSCSKKGDVIYSCDPEIDSWVKENLKSLKDIDRDKLAEFTFNEQKAIYRSLTNTKKAEIWIAKLDSIESYSWPLGFSELLDELKVEIDSNFFSSSYIENSKSFIENWIEEVLEINGIDTLQVIHSFMTISTIGEIGETIYQAQPGGEDCDCRWSSVCYLFNEGYCVNGLHSCASTYSGCGFLWLYSCNGMCDGGVI